MKMQFSKVFNIAFIFCVSQTMSSDVLRVKLRVNNNIYSVKMSPAGVTDVLMQGIDSTTVKAIVRGRPESIVTGQFANQVEVLSAVNQSDISKAQENSEERMEIEVSYFNYF